jgi:hypothetical protein
LLTGLVLVGSGVAAYFSIVVGVGTAAVGLALLAMRRRFVRRRWQRGLKDLLGRIPVYRQVLKKYPWAVVVMPEEPISK